MADDPRRGRSRRRRLHGEGSIYGPRKDGLYVGAFYTRTSAGRIKRVYVYGKTWKQARDRLVEEQSKAIRGIPAAAESWKLAAYLDYWLENIVRPSRRAATYDLYEGVIRLYLKPGLGHYWLRRLSVPIVQSFLNAKLAEGKSIRNVHIMRELLSAALTRAVRGELIGRNVARLTDLPGRESRDIQPWSADEAIELLRIARPDPLYPAFVPLLGHTQLHQHNPAPSLQPLIDRRQAPRQPKSPQAARSVTQVPELLSRTYRNHVRKLSPGNRNSDVQHLPGPHTSSTASVAVLLCCTGARARSSRGVLAGGAKGI